MSKHLILASTSSYRKELLARLGWEFSTLAPGVDEDKIKQRGLAPAELAIELSKLKASSVFSRNVDSWVIGSDQVCTLQGEILDKPGTLEKAIEQLKKMQGKTHELHTAVTLLSAHGEKSFLNTTRLTMRELRVEDIIQYVEADRPLDCAGSYKIESQGIKLFRQIETTDHTAIMGLPLIQLTTLLLEQQFTLSS